MMLADTLIPMYLIWGPAAGVASLLIAVLVEVPLLRLFWRKPLLQLVLLVLAANLVSAAVGVCRPVAQAVAIGINTDSDPLAVVQSYWPNQIWLARTLFTITLGVEFCVYLSVKYLV